MKPHKRWRLLVRKLEYLRLELEETKESFEKYEAEFTKKVQEIEQPIIESQPPPPEKDPPKEVTVRAPDEVIYENGEKKEQEPQPDIQADDFQDRPESLRKLWKLIASKTHPDVNKGNEELTDLYKSANAAWKKMEIEVLIEIAAELKIDIPDPDQKMVKILQGRCEAIETEIEKMTNSPIWEWGNADEEFRSMMVQGVVDKRAERRKK